MQAIATAPIYRTRKGKPIILCVDDVKEILDTLEEQLSAHLGKDFAFESALSGEEGLEVIEDLLRRGKEVAVIISDVIMPGMKGDEFLIRAHKLTPRTLKIMLTGQESTLSQITNAINLAHLYRFISKPWDILDMQRTIEEAARSYVQRNLIEEQNRILKLLHHSAQVIARQVDLQDLYGEALRLMLEYSGAERAAFVLETPDGLVVQATSESGQPSSLVDAEPAEDNEYAPGKLLQEILRTKQEIVLSNALQEGHYMQDEYVKKHLIKSIIGLPLINQGKVMGIIYLESRREPGLFSADRVEVLNILASQAAIAIDNGFLYERLEDLVHARTRQLMAANIQKDEMVRFVSHEIRSPLAGVASLIELLNEPEIAENTNEVLRYAGLIRNSTGNVMKLANDILDLAKLESGTISLTKKPVIMGSFLEDVAQSYEPLTMAKEIQLKVDIETPVTIEADESKLSSVVGNLLSNAIKFTSKGGSIKLALRKHTAGGKQLCEIEVKDTGMGIKEDQLPLLFEKFGSKQRLGTDGERGTGLGLSIVKELVVLHGGEVSARSVVDKGSSFFVHLPL